MELIKFSCDLSGAHARALQILIDRLDYEALARRASSAQESFDMVIALEKLSSALKEGGQTVRGCGQGHGARNESRTPRTAAATRPW